MKNPTMYLGIDAHKSFSQVCLMTEKGDLVDEQRLINFTQEAEKFYTRISKNKVKAAIEATGIVMPIVKELEKYGIEVSVAHPAKTKLIAEAKIKTDKVDARALANLLRTNFLPTCYLPNQHTRNLRELVRDRAKLTRLRSTLKIQIRHALLNRGIIKEGNIFAQERTQELKDLRIDTIDRRLYLIDELNKIISELSSEIKASAEQDEMASLLATMPGIGYYTALLIVSEIGEIERFPSSKKLCSYAGLVPSLHQSGSTMRRGHITRQGSKWLRWSLIQCAHIAVRKDARFKLFYTKLAKRKGNKKAIVAVARKMLGTAYWMMKHKNTYQEELMLMKERSSNENLG